jgi:hypothetical protein
MNSDQIDSFHNAAEEGKLVADKQIVEVELNTHRRSISLSSSVSDSA